MKKRDRLFTVNKWNQRRLFYPGGPLNTGTDITDTSGQNTTVTGAPTSGVVVKNPTSWDEVTPQMLQSQDYFTQSPTLASTQNTTAGINTTAPATSATKETTGRTPLYQTIQNYVGTAPTMDALMHTLNVKAPLPSVGEAATAAEISRVVSGGSPTSTASSLSLGANRVSDATTLTGRFPAPTTTAPITPPTIPSYTPPPSFMDKVALAGDKVSNLGKAGISVGAAILGGLGKRVISDGLKTGAGEAISTVGNVAGSALNWIPGVGWALGPAVTLFGNLLGGTVNRLWGHKTFGVDDAKSYLANMSGTNFNGASNDQILALSNSIAAPKRVTYRDGIFTDAGKNEARLWNDRTARAQDFTQRQLEDAVQNNNAEQYENMWRNNAFYGAYGGLMPSKKAFGGPLFDTSNMSATNYSLMSDWLNTKALQAQNKNSVVSGGTGAFSLGNTFALGGGIHINPKNKGKFNATKKRTGKTTEQLTHSKNPITRKRAIFAKNAKKWKHALGGPLEEGAPLYALGGVLQSHGTNWSNGVTEVNAGGSHEENPNEGVQMGVDNQGTPNLVEEGEVIWNDYVFSKRLKVPKEVQRALKVYGKDLTFADAAKKLTKEFEETPNDPISKAGLDAALSRLAQAQEELKQEMAAEEAQEAFESLSPEQQIALMQQAAAQQQQPAAEEGVPVQQEPSPGEAAMAEQAMAQQGVPAATMAGSELNAQMQPQISAYGGPLDDNSKGNKFAGTNVFKDSRLPRRYRNYNRQWFMGRARALGIPDADMGTYQFSSDPEANLANFNIIYRNYLRNRALDTYVAAQRQAKRNALFGDNGTYRLTDDGKNILKAKIADTDYSWIDSDNNPVTQEAYNEALKALQGAKYADDAAKTKAYDEFNAKYRRLDRPVYKGDKMVDFNGRTIWEPTLEGTTEDSILDQYKADYEKGFKWDDKDFQAMQYPVSMQHSTLSGLRYVPGVGGAIGLTYGLLDNPDYSRADAIRRAGNYIPLNASAPTIGDYLPYKPMDVNYGLNQLAASSGATRRGILNSGTGPARLAGLTAAGYNDLIGRSNLYRQALEYDLAQLQKAGEFNRGTNQFNATQLANASRANQAAYMQAAQDRYKSAAASYALMDDIDNRRQTGITANLTNTLTSIGNIGEEAYDEDRLRWLENTGVLKSDYFNSGKYAKGTTYAACGGMLTKKSKKKGGKR